MKTALLNLFETTNKKISRDKPYCWKQDKKDCVSNQYFNKILVDLTDEGVKDQTYVYSCRQKQYILKSLCTKEYSKLSAFLEDGERIEAFYVVQGR